MGDRAGEHCRQILGSRGQTWIIWETRCLKVYNSKQYPHAGPHPLRSRHSGHPCQGDRFVTACLDAPGCGTHSGERVGERCSMSICGEHGSVQPDGQYVVTAADNGAMRVWDGMNGHPISEAIYLASSVDRRPLSANGRFVIAFPEKGRATVFWTTRCSWRESARRRRDQR